MNLEPRLFNIPIGIAELGINYLGLYTVNNIFEDNVPVYLVLTSLHIADCLTVDSISRIFFNTPFYRVRLNQKIINEMDRENSVNDTIN